MTVPTYAYSGSLRLTSNADGTLSATFDGRRAQRSCVKKGGKRCFMNGDFSYNVALTHPASRSISSAARVGRIVVARPRRELAGALAQAPARPARARTARRTRAGAHSRRGTRTPTPAQSMRAAFSFMSPAAGTTTTTQPLASARASVPWPPWQTTTSQRGIVRA